MTPTPTEVYDYEVSELRAGGELSFAEGMLTVDTEELRAFLLEDEKLTDVQVNLGSPGDDIRIIHALDSVRPVCNADGLGRGAFPGILSPMDTMSTGTSHRMQGLVVTSLGLTSPVDSLLTQQEGILDLTGEGSRYSPLARERHIILSLETSDDLDNLDRARAHREATLSVAERLGSLLRGADGGKPVEGVTSAASRSHDVRPRVVHVCGIATFGRLFETLVAGQPSFGMVPTFVSNRALADGLIVSEDYHYAGQRNLTCFYQDDPVSRMLLGTFCERAEYAGTILLPVGGSAAEKNRNANYAASLAQFMDADGVIVTAVAAGHSHLDAMYCARACEQRGILAALELVELAGPGGTDSGMMETVPEVNLMISVGNRDQIVRLPPRGQVLGGDVLIGESLGMGEGSVAAGEIWVPLRAILGATNELGAWNVHALAC